MQSGIRSYRACILADPSHETDITCPGMHGSFSGIPDFAKSIFSFENYRISPDRKLQQEIDLKVSTDFSGASVEDWLKINNL